MMNSENFIGIFALSSAICAHYLTVHHDGCKEPWYRNSWFWLALVGNLPALIGLSVHLILKNMDKH